MTREALLLIVELSVFRSARSEKGREQVATTTRAGKRGCKHTNKQRNDVRELCPSTCWGLTRCDRAGVLLARGLCLFSLVSTVRDVLLPLRL